jgi:phosphoribosylglycinamide formyltransferase 1
VSNQRRLFAVVISGRGSNMAAILAAAQRGDIPVDVVSVIADRDAAGLAIARSAGIPVTQVNAREYASREAFDTALKSVIEASGAEFIALAGFMRILSAGFVMHYTGRLLNIHPSLLPKFKGLDTHQRALDAHEREHGASVHYVMPELDGGPVIAQARVPILTSDSAGTLSARVHTVEHILYPRVCGWVAAGRVTLQDGRVCFDGVPLEAPLTERD